MEFVFDLRVVDAELCDYIELMAVLYLLIVHASYNIDHRKLYNKLHKSIQAFHENKDMNK
jgi:uncharacterized protein YutE (UPF0331/DUF86 family)